MAILIPARGEPRNVTPATGEAFTLAELQAFVGGYIEVVRTPLTLAADGTPLLMFLNEDGKRLELPVNAGATGIVRHVIRPDDVIVGDVVVCTLVEAGQHEDEE